MELEELEKSSNARFNDTFDYEPIDPVTNEPKGFTVTLKSAKQDDLRRFVEQRTKTVAIEQFKAQQVGKLYFPSLKEVEKADIEYACLATVQFNGLTKGGKPYGVTADEIRDIYSNFQWLVKQVFHETLNDANFLQA